MSLEQISRPRLYRIDHNARFSWWWPTICRTSRFVRPHKPPPAFNDEQINAIIRAFEMPSIDHPLLKGAELSPTGSEPTFLVAEKCGLASFAVTSSGR